MSTSRQSCSSPYPGFVLRPIGLDDMAQVRHVHVAACRAVTASHLSALQVDSLLSYIRSSQYADLVLSADPLGVWSGDLLCGTGGWAPAGDSGRTARLTGVSIDPIFWRLGLGRALALAVEERCARAGFPSFVLRSMADSEGFYLRLGYRVSTHGVWTTPSGVTIPAVFLRKGEPLEKPGQGARATAGRPMRPERPI